MSDSNTERAPITDSQAARTGRDAWALLSSFTDLEAGFALTVNIENAAIDHAVLLHDLLLTDPADKELATLSPDLRQAVLVSATYLRENPPPWSKAQIDELTRVSRSIKNNHGTETGKSTSPGDSTTSDEPMGFIQTYESWLGIGAANESSDRLGVQMAFVNVLALALNDFVPSSD